MLHILWILLKIILLIVGIVLGLLLLCILLVFFCPVTYRGTGSYQNKKPEASAKVSWLFHILTFQFEYREETSVFQVKILGISADRYQSLLGRLKRRKKISLPPQSEEAPKETVPFSEAVKEETKQEEKSPEKSAEPVKPEPVRNKKREEKKKKEKTGIFSRIRKKISDWKRTWKGLGRQISWWRTFLEQEQIQEALRFLWSEIRDLLKHISPRHLSGYVRFGLEDPSLTGAVLAGLGITCPIHKNRLEIRPVFDETVFEAQAKVSGRIFGVFLIKILLSVYFNKNVKYMIKRWNQKEG